MLSISRFKFKFGLFQSSNWQLEHFPHIFCLFVSDAAVGDLIARPEDASVRMKRDVRFHCATDIHNRPIDWSRTLVNSDSPHDIYYGNTLIDSLPKRYRVEVNHNEDYDLVIAGVELEDAGTYTCKDNAAFGENADAELVVLGELSTAENCLAVYD